MDRALSDEQWCLVGIFGIDSAQGLWEELQGVPVQGSHDDMYEIPVSGQGRDIAVNIQLGRSQKAHTLSIRYMAFSLLLPLHP